MQNKSYMSLFLVAIIVITTHSQVSQQWVKRYNGSLNTGDQPARILTDRQGSSIVVGVTNHQTNPDILLLKYNPAGDTLWTRTYAYSATSDEWAHWAVLDDSGNVYITGTTSFAGSLLTMKFSSAGMLQWTQRLPLPFYKKPNDIMYDNGFVYITCEHQPQANYPWMTYTIKYNAVTGDTLWTRRYGGTGTSRGYGKKLAKDGTGNIYLGVWGSNSSFPVQVGLIKYSPSGDSLFVTFADTSARIAVFNDMERDAQGNFYITGQGGSTGQDIMVVKLNSSGQLQWSRYMGHQTIDDNAFDIHIDITGGIYVVGYMWTGSFDFRDFLTIKYNSNGDTVWTRRYSSVNPRYNDEAHSITSDNSGNIYVTGIGAVSTFQNEYVTVKYNPSGVQQWLIKYRGPANINNWATSVAVDTSQNVYVTGYDFTASGNYDYDIVSIKYVQTPTGITANNNTIPAEFALFQSYPNPFNPVSHIEFDIPLSSFVKLNVYDVNGKEVSSLINENKSAGHYTIEFNGTNLASGIYFYRIIAEGEGQKFVNTKKMLLVK